VERTLCQSLDDDRTLPELWSRGVPFPAPPAMEMIADGHQRDLLPYGSSCSCGRLFENQDEPNE